jgi:hypothetical protein
MRGKGPRGRSRNGKVQIKIGKCRFGVAKLQDVGKHNGSYGLVIFRIKSKGNHVILRCKSALEKESMICQTNRALTSSPHLHHEAAVVIVKALRFLDSVHFKKIICSSRGESFGIFRKINLKNTIPINGSLGIVKHREITKNSSSGAVVKDSYREKFRVANELFSINRNEIV